MVCPMDIQRKEISATGVKLFAVQDGKEVARAYLYLMRNDLHERPFGFMEDVFVDESLRGQGIGTRILDELIAEARRRGCYKLIGTSRHERPKVHSLYERLGFKDHGKEFRMDFS
jgi:GNAT superfamily N-acetyltransferase